MRIVLWIFLFLGRGSRVTLNIRLWHALLQNHSLEIKTKNGKLKTNLKKCLKLKATGLRVRIISNLLIFHCFNFQFQVIVGPKFKNNQTSEINSKNYYSYLSTGMEYYILNKTFQRQI